MADIYGEWANVVTTRHIVSQTSGQGRIPPGVAMTYDSDAFIQKLSPLMGKILAKDNMTVLDWAERYFAKPLGTPLYTFMHLYSRTHTCVTPIIHVYTPIYTPRNTSKHPTYTIYTPQYTPYIHHCMPLGIEGVFLGDAYIGGGNVSTGGGQLMTCRQVRNNLLTPIKQPINT